jgi:hypothetical protein
MDDALLLMFCVYEANSNGTGENTENDFQFIVRKEK